MLALTAIVLAAISVLLVLYTYLGYPTLLWCLGRMRSKPLASEPEDREWPTVSISVPAYNEEDQIGELIQSLLALDYPCEKVQIVVVSDASSDRTDEIVGEYAEHGVQLVRLSERGGKTRAESAAAKHLTGEIIVNTDASIRILPDALRRLISVFRDPEIGCASGRDLSVGSDDAAGSSGESGYVGYEMAVRDLETRVHGIVGASGCFYAIRPDLHRVPLPESLSRDFAAALHTHENGYRAVSVPGAVCLVPRSSSLRREYRRKVRTMTRGMQTLFHKRALLNPFREGVFAWMLLSHKVCRWALPWGVLSGAIAVGVLGFYYSWAQLAITMAAIVLVLALIGWSQDGHEGLPKLISLPAFVVAANVAAAHALIRAVVGARDAVWEPTRRPVIDGN